MKTVQLRKVKAVVADAERGRPTLITRHGEPRAMVVPVADGRRLHPEVSPSLADYLLAIPLGARIPLRRSRRPMRSIRM